MASQTLPNTVRNTAGTVLYYCCQWLTTVFVVRIAGYDVSGTFSLVISYANIFGFISLYNLRNYQLSDVTHRFQSAQYTAAYSGTSIASLLLFFIVLPFCGFDRYTILCSIAYMLFKYCETAMHYLFTYYQLKDQYGRILLSFCLKSFLPLAGFVAMLYAGLGLLWAILLMAAVFLLTILLYDIPRMKDANLKGFSTQGILTILKESFPLMLSTLVLPYMLFFMRYAVEDLYGAETLGYFATVSMVTVIMNTLAGSVWFVIMPSLSRYFVSKDYGRLKKQVVIISAAVLLITAALVPLGEWVGGWVFSLIFGAEILPHMYLLPMTIISSGFLTVATFLSTVLIAIRKRMLMLLSMLIGAVLLTALAFPLTNACGSIGALYAFTAAVCLEIIPMLIIVFHTCRKGTVKL
ncbi:MAG TPA: hypothetical protein PK537_09200 [Candidatus Limiplasma sp.]|nr:hypothetical protein [Candidatus Limiplasma sp.]